MGIVNVTPDSFSHDGCLASTATQKQSRISTKNFTAKAISQALKMVAAGADILDIGGESTRPGARAVSAKEETTRVIPIMRALVKKIKIPISVDTYKASVAQAALDTGASIVNNIKGVPAEKRLLKIVKNYDAAIVLMHMRGNPRTMQKNIHYHNLISEIITSLRNSIEICLEIGIKSDKIIIDPGIGFGKTAQQNLEILNRLNEFAVLKCPILVGTSRKSFIGKVLDNEVHERLLGTIASVCSSIHTGAHIVRVHDVKEIKEAARITDAILNQKILTL